MKAASRHFKARHPSWCPLCKGRIHEGEMIVKVTPMIRWHQERKYKGSGKPYIQELTHEYVHVSCFEKKQIPLEEH